MKRLFLALSLTAALLLALGLSVGATGFTAWWSGDALEQQILWDIRLPRVLGAALAGALLALSGAVAQGLFRNPLADPFLLGSAAGASLGVSTALAMSGVALVGGGWLGQFGVSTAAFVGAIGGVLMALALAQGAQHSLRLLLAGVVVGVVLTAAKEWVTIAWPHVLRATQGYTLGTTAYVGWAGNALMAAAFGVCSAVAWANARVLDGLSLGEDSAASLGLPLVQARWWLLAAMSLATGVAVAQVGLVAFVGLAAPHMARRLRQARHGQLLFLSAAVGALLLMAADVLARAIIWPLELPVGILTGLLGGVYLLWLMRRGQVGAAA
jgi:iron complex transport system permease protein